jgi:hypothetical protein
MMEDKNLDTNPFSRIIIATGLLWVVFASRVLGLSHMPLHHDEALLAMRATGTLKQIIVQQPPDWPPLYNVLVNLWMRAAGRLPFALQSLSIFIFLLAVVLTYHAAYRLFRSARAAWSTTLVYAALGFSVHLSTFIRGYALTIALFPLALWLTINYFEKPRWQRALPLALTLTAMFYTTYTAFFPFVLLGLYTVFTTPREIWRWWLPAAFAVPLALPELVYKSNYLLNQVSDPEPTSAQLLPPFSQAILETLRDYAGQYYGVWLALAIVAVALIVWSERKLSTRLVWLLLGVILGPVTLYVCVDRSIFVYFQTRYTWWALFMIALGLGYGLSHLSRTAWAGCGVVLVFLMFTLPSSERYKPEFDRPIGENFRWLQQHLQPGDVMVVDPNADILNNVDTESVVWAYAFDVYFGNQLEIVNEPGDYRRVWYVYFDGWEDPDFKAAVRHNRIPTIFVGPWNMLIRMYEGPPDPDGILFENGLRFHGFDIMDGEEIARPPYDLNEYDTLRIRLWWSVDHALDADYSISVQIHSKGAMIAQNDSAPQLIHLSPVDTSPLPSETSQWEPGRYYIEEREISLPDLERTINTQIRLTVYQWWDGVRIPAPGVDEDRLLLLTRITIWGWG